MKTSKKNSKKRKSQKSNPTTPTSRATKTNPNSTASPARRILYSKWFEGGDTGEGTGMYEVVDSKLVLVAAFDANDADWRGEYMDGILSHFGIDREKLPEQYNAEAERLYCENFGL